MNLFDSDNLLRFTKMVKCLPEFEYFYCVLENKNIIFKIRRSKVTDYAALSDIFIMVCKKFRVQLHPRGPITHTDIL